jgi:hypothetical protein
MVQELLEHPVGSQQAQQARLLVDPVGPAVFQPLNFWLLVDTWCASVVFAGNLLRGGDTRGYNSLAKMYTIDCAMTAS